MGSSRGRLSTFLYTDVKCIKPYQAVNRIHSESGHPTLALLGAIYESVTISGQVITTVPGVDSSISSITPWTSLIFMLRSCPVTPEKESDSEMAAKSMSDWFGKP